MREFIAIVTPLSVVFGTVFALWVVSGIVHAVVSPVRYGSLVPLKDAIPRMLETAGLVLISVAGSLRSSWRLPPGDPPAGP